MKTVKKRTILLVIAMMLVLSMTLGLTLAYFSDHTEAKGGAMLALGAKDEIHERVDENSKSVWIENTGETNIVVRAAIYGPTQMKVKADTSLWEENGGYYYYKQILKPGELTKEGSLVADTEFPEGTDLGPEFEIVVVQECAQAIYGDGNIVSKPAGWNHIPTIQG